MDSAYWFEGAAEDAGVSVMSQRQTSAAHRGHAEWDSRARGLVASVNHPDINMWAQRGKPTRGVPQRQQQGSWLIFNKWNMGVIFVGLKALLSRTN